MSFSAKFAASRDMALILAHPFDDKFEWFLMQLGRGAGLELLDMQELEAREDYCGHSSAFRRAKVRTGAVFA